MSSCVQSVYCQEGLVCLIILTVSQNDVQNRSQAFEEGYTAVNGNNMAFVWLHDCDTNHGDACRNDDT